ncbi:MAG: cold-shock protein [Phycisphaerae bacterium]|nr:cold-shock protein [Phycisphaerae bacterium]
MTDQERLEEIEGQVKWFDPRKGFGFLVGPDGQDIFVHFTSIEQSEGFRTLRDGETVLYSAAQGPKGWAASKVSPLARTSTKEPVAESMGGDSGTDAG